MSNESKLRLTAFSCKARLACATAGGRPCHTYPNKKMRIPILLVTFLLGVAVAQDVQSTDATDKSPEEAAMDAAFKVYPDPKGQDYFPKGKESYYTRYLAAMKEPSVQAKLPDNSQMVFRFTYLRSFHNPIAIRITKQGSVFLARVVVLEKDRHHQPVKLSLDKEISFKDAAATTIASLIPQKNFWKPLTDGEEYAMRSGTDGSSWIFEIHDSDGYRMIDVWSPGTLKKYHDMIPNGRDFDLYETLGKKLLKLAEVLPKVDELY